MKIENKNEELSNVVDPKVKKEKVINTQETEKIKEKVKAKVKNKVQDKSKIKIIPLGGLNEIGKNITAIEYKDKIYVIDCGLKFPEEEMYGIDLVIPDTSYLVKNQDKIVGLFLTHAHEDHIGAIPYVLKSVKMDIYGTKLTLGILECKLKEHGLLASTKLTIVKPKDVIKFDNNISVEFLKQNHSVADALAIVIHTPLGAIIHTGDFKIDYTPIDGEVGDLGRFAELGKEGVLLLLSDSTNVGKKGYTITERSVGETFKKVFSNAKGRIIVASFASNIHRIQQIIDASLLYGRKVAFSGRSMENIVAVAKELGYIDLDDKVAINIDNINKYPKEKVTIITTGSQGEPMSALSRMASSDHRKVEIIPGDLIVISATPIPGNEKLVSRVINQLIKKGADVVYNEIEAVHVSGHACEEELKLMQVLTRPKFFMPVHGEYRHLVKHAELAVTLGMPKENTVIVENGDVIEVTKDLIKKNGTVSSGQIFVDGLGIGDVGNIVLRDRRHLSQDGILTVVITMERASGIVVSGPDIISRGFVYVRESEKLMEESKEIVKGILAQCEENKVHDWSTIKANVRDALRTYLYEKTKRKPMILPIIMEI